MSVSKKEPEKNVKSIFEFPSFKIEFNEILTKETWGRIKQFIDTLLEGEVSK